MKDTESPIRDTNLDFIRGGAISLVVLGHALNDQTYADAHIDIVVQWFVRLIYSFHIPLFFFVAGASFNWPKKNSNFTSFILHKGMRLLIPFLSFTLLYCLIADPSLLTNLTKISSLFLMANHGALDTLPVPKLFWFLPCLFSMNVLFYIYKTYLGDNLSFGSQLVLFISLQLISYWVFHNFLDHSQAPYSVDVAIFSLLFFWLGTGNRLPILTAQCRNSWIAFWAFLALIALSFFYQTRPHENIARLDFTYWEVLLFDISAFAGIVMFRALAPLMAMNNTPYNGIAKLGLASMTIYCLHQPILKLIRMAFPASLWGSAIGFVVALMCATAIDTLFKRNHLMSFFLNGIHKKRA